MFRIVFVTYQLNEEGVGRDMLMQDSRKAILLIPAFLEASKFLGESMAGAGSIPKKWSLSK
jgi:hypothetical protein